MRDFNKVKPTIWQAGWFASLGMSDRYLYLYFLTCPQQNSAGCFVLPDAYACADLGGWDVKKYRETKEALEVGAELITTDANTNEVLINNWFVDNCPMNQKHYLGTTRLISGIQSDALRLKAEEGLAEVWKRTHPPTAPTPTGSNVSPELLAKLQGRR